MDGLEVYGPLDLFLPVPVLIGYGLYALCLRLLLYRLGKARVYLPVGPSAVHRFYRLSVEGEEWVGGRREDIVGGLGRARHPQFGADQELHVLQVILPPILLAYLVAVVVAGVPDGYPRRLLGDDIRQVFLLNRVLEIGLHVVHIEAYLLLKRRV